jgi:hypothetical protein
MTYKLTTKGNKIEVSLTKNELVTQVDKLEYAVSLARTGGQGSKGDTITSAYIDPNNNLIIEVTSSGGVVSTINAGTLSVSELYSLAELNDVSLSGLATGDVLIYNSDSQEFTNHKLTTSKVTDIDNTNKTDGALLVYKGSTQKYTATTTLDNANTAITGGYF